MADFNNLNNTLSSDRSSIIVLSNSLDTEIVSHNSLSELSSHMATNSTANTSNTIINCVNDSFSHTGGANSLANSLNRQSASISNSVDNDGISVLNTMRNQKDTFCLEDHTEHLKRELNAYKQENSELKEQYDYLASKMEKLSGAVQSKEAGKYSTSSIANTSSNSDDQFIDVQTIVLIEKIENYLTETNRLFTDERKFKLAMNYMLNHFWSIIAYQYNDENLTKLKALRDSLLAKIDNVDKIVAASVLATEQDQQHLDHRHQNSVDHATSSMNSSINVIDLENEIETFKQDAMLIKSKVVQQSELLKNLIENMMSSNKSVSNENQVTLERNAISVKETVIENENTYQEYSFSPSTSPTSCMFEYFQRKFNTKPDSLALLSTSQQATNENSNEKNSSPEVNSNEFKTLTPTSETAPAVPTNSASSHSINSSSSSSDNTQGQEPDNSAFYFYYHVNDYIAIDKTLALNEQLKEEKAIQNQISSVNTSPASSSNISKLNQTNSSSFNEDSILSSLPQHANTLQISIEPAPTETLPTTSDNNANTKDSEANLALYQCPSCQLSVDPKSVSFEIFNEHVLNCINNNEQLVCMFCLTMFEKDDLAEYELHIESHLGVTI